MTYDFGSAEVPIETTDCLRVCSSKLTNGSFFLCCNDNQSDVLYEI